MRTLRVAGLVMVLAVAGGAVGLETARANGGPKPAAAPEPEGAKLLGLPIGVWVVIALVGGLAVANHFMKKRE